MSLLTFENITKSFSSGTKTTVLNHISFDVDPGQFVAITGPSGQGKSTLLAIAAGLLAPDEGDVLFDGESVLRMPEPRLNAYRSRDLGFIYQKPKTFAALTAYENVFFALKQRFGRDAKERAEAALEAYGLADVADNLPSQLSFGQLRRLAITRTLACEPRMLLADEPTNDLDVRWCEQVMADLAAFAAKEGRAVVMVTHDTRYVPLVPVRYRLSGEGISPCE
ncbi:MAG: ATP-binding cassette domain-containing protein [Eggerthellaceae bacterium]|nr:ATP-binding cassette domain-containing protein [Eggerthellaceae bacterium]